MYDGNTVSETQQADAHEIGYHCQAHAAVALDTANPLHLVHIEDLVSKPEATDAKLGTMLLASAKHWVPLRLEHVYFTLYILHFILYTKLTIHFCW